MAIVVAAAVAAYFFVPAASDAWTTWRTGVAPGSREATAFAAVTGDLVLVGMTPTKEGATPEAWRITHGRWVDVEGVRDNDWFFDIGGAGDHAAAAGASAGRPTVFDIRDGRATATSFDGRTGDLMSIAVCGTDAVAVGTLTEERLKGFAVGRRYGRGWEALDIGDVSMAPTVACSGDGFFIGASRAISNSQAVPLVLEGTPGGAWKETALEAPGRSAVMALAATSSRTVAVGLADLAPAAWVREGDTWSFAGHLTEGAPPGERVRAVVADPSGGFVAVGSRTGLGDVISPVAWRSDDGRSWQPVGVSGSRSTGLTDVTVVGRRVIAIGNDVERKRHRPQLYELRGSALVPTRGG